FYHCVTIAFISFIFFFQAEDGIRDRNVTGVQTCALPIWAVAFREDSVKHVYFVAETKGNDIEVSQLRRAEDAKIECARRHFAAISTGDVAYSVVKTHQDLYNAVTK